MTTAPDDPRKARCSRQADAERHRRAITCLLLGSGCVVTQAQNYRTLQHEPEHPLRDLAERHLELVIALRERCLECIAGEAAFSDVESLRDATLAIERDMLDSGQGGNGFALLSLGPAGTPYKPAASGVH